MYLSPHKQKAGLKRPGRAMSSWWLLACSGSAQREPGEVPGEDLDVSAELKDLVEQESNDLLLVETKDLVWELGASQECLARARSSRCWSVVGLLLAALRA